jgi:hypothetical protein
MRLSSIGSFIKRNPTFLVGILGGSMGIFIDFDHIINYLYPQEQGGRFLHGWFCLGSIVVLCGAITFVTRLYYKTVLKK